MTSEIRLIQKEAAQYFDVSPKTLRNWESEDWFPDGGRTSEGYDVEVIERHRAAMEREEKPVAERPVRFRARCPKSSFHSAEVRKTEGRIRYCVCQSCGHSFQQVGPENPLRQSLSSIASSLSALEAVDVQGEQVVIMTVADRSQLLQLCK